MKVLISDPITVEGQKILTEAGLEVVFLPDASASEKAIAARAVQGWILRSGTTITSEMIAGAESLQVIGRAGVGIDNIDLKAATRRGIVVMNTPDVNTISAAEHTVAMMLSLSRNIHIGHGGLLLGKWNRDGLVGTELRNKTLGVVGLGKIGQEVIKRCRPFRMNILGYDPYVSQDPFSADEGRVVSLDELTAQADYITLHVPLTNATQDLFDYKRLCQMKPTARILNVARGGIIKEADLAQALNEEKIAGAAVDVFTVEPLEESNPLIKAKNIVLTPHLGAATQEAKEGVSRAVCEQVRDFLVYEKLHNAVNIPISNLRKLKEIQHHLELAEVMGKLQNQLLSSVLKKIHVECAGTMAEAKLAALAFIKGLLADRVPERVNYINAETLAIDLGIKIEHSYSSDSGAYTNIIRTVVSSAKETNEIHGSIFEGKRLRLVNIFGYEMDITPRGTMLFARNKDVPGVIGKVGTALGRAKVNIGAYLLSRDAMGQQAFAVIRVDNPVPDEILKTLIALDEITYLQQIHC